MTTSIMLNVFSGRPNPRQELSGEAEKELHARLVRLKPTERQPVHDLRSFDWGVIRVVRQGKGCRSTFYAGGGVIDFPHLPFAFLDTEGVGRFLLDSFPSLWPSVREFLYEHRRTQEMIKRTPAYHCDQVQARDATPFDMGWAYSLDPELGHWYRDPCNNCYDYANQQLTDTFSQPGVGSGQHFGNHDCASLIAAAERDGLVKVAPSDITKSPVRGKVAGWYVALFLGEADGQPDFHWLKQDSSGCWSHKPGPQRPRETDFQGFKISSPTDALLIHPSLPVKYDTFCGYFRTRPGVTIKGTDPVGCPPYWF